MPCNLVRQFHVLQFHVRHFQRPHFFEGAIGGGRNFTGGCGPASSPPWNRPCNNVRDLDVLVDSRLTFRDHINSIVSRGHNQGNENLSVFSMQGCLKLDSSIYSVRPTNDGVL